MSEPSPVTRAALRVSWLSIGWSAASGSAAIAIGQQARSLALIGSGASVLIDLSSSVVLVWRFRRHESHPRAEQIAHLVAAAALVTLGAALAAAATWRLVDGGRAHPTAGSVVVAAASVVALPIIGWRKYRVAARIPSRALATDAHITMVGAGTALVTLAGLALTTAGIASADAAATFVITATAGVVGVSELRAAAHRG